MLKTRLQSSGSNTPQLVELPQSYPSRSAAVIESWPVNLDSQSQTATPDPRSQVQEAFQETFGVILAEIFLVLSVLSKSQEYVRLPAIANLQEFPVIGYGASFLARKIPRKHVLGSDSKRFPGHKSFVYKSLRHYSSPRGDGENTQDRRATKLKNVLLEIQVLTHPSLRNHENIVALVGFGWELNRLDKTSHVFHWPFVILEYAQFGSMVELFDEENIDFETRRRLCVDIGQGLLALHSCSIVHGDVKMENILIFPHNSRRFVAKLVDFGYSMVDPDGKSQTTKLKGGTRPWYAPEQNCWLAWNDLHLTDIYSFGLVIWRTMCYGHPPFHRGGGIIDAEMSQEIVAMAQNDSMLEVATISLSDVVLNEELLENVQSGLGFCLRRNPKQRNLQLCIESLG
jgi:serine/threonine protein kinase